MTQNVLRNSYELTVAELDAVAGGFLSLFSLFLPLSFGNESISAPAGKYGHEVAAVPTGSGSAVFVSGHGNGNGNGNFTNGNGQGNGVGNVFF
jgi:hypothetical protein